MLNRLSIKNYAIIHSLDIDFSEQLNVITGETGAGKSIIVGALSLILGQRAESGVLLNKELKCVVEGIFKDEASDNKVVAFLKNHDLDLNDELVVRREIAPNGKSRAFINDTPVNLSQLHTLSSILVDLHQQFDTLSLGETDFQRDVLDALAGNFPLLKKYKGVYNEAHKNKIELQGLKEEKARFEKEFDYHQFQFTELDEAGFKENELEELEIELKLLSNAEAIKNALTKANYELEDGEQPIIRQLKNINNQLQQYSDLHPDLNSLLERLQSSYIEMQDIADEFNRINDAISTDITSIDKINERLSFGYKLLKKHNVKTTSELLEIKEDLHQKLQAVLNINDAIETAENNYNSLLKEALEIAGSISKGRKSVVNTLEEKVNKMLAQVGMPNAGLKIDIKETELSASGFDDVEFLFDANLSSSSKNKTANYQPVRKVASGGELSRLMLCIKSLVATSMNLPTLIFDEIDTGISGEAAKQVGVILKDLAVARQIICITHQPQIAGKANAHFFVYKSVINYSITTSVRLLNTDERIVAIAKMLSGEKPTTAALENAREMVMN